MPNARHLRTLNPHLEHAKFEAHFETEPAAFAGHPELRTSHRPQRKHVCASIKHWRWPGVSLLHVPLTEVAVVRHFVAPLVSSRLLWFLGRSAPKS